MEPQEAYILKDFKRYARNHFPTEFASFRDLHAYQFEKRTYLDENSAVHEMSMLLVGQYHRRHSGPQVWAHSTGSCVRYYQGKTLEDVCTLIPEEHTTRIYYCAPYSFMIGSQEGRGGTAGRKAGQFVVETVIDFLFLLTGRLKRVSNTREIDMLSNFKYACMNSKPKRDVRETDHTHTLQQTERHSACEMVEQKTRKRKRTSENGTQQIKEEEDDGTDVTFSQSAPTGRPDTVSQFQTGHAHQLPSSSPVPYKLTRDTQHTYLLDQLRNCKADMESKLEQERRIRFERVQALQKELKQEELRTQAAEEMATCEKKKRKRAEEQIEDLRLKEATHQEQIHTLEAKCIEYEAQHNDQKITGTKQRAIKTQRKRSRRSRPQSMVAIR